MANNITPFNSNQPPKIGEANPLRGAGYHDVAVKFVRTFPVGTVLSTKEFDEFTIANGINHEPSDRTKGGEPWQAFVQRRHQAKVGLNKAGSHPRMQDEDRCQPFSISKVKGGLEVKSSLRAAVTTEAGKQVNSLISTKKQALRYLLQSVDYPSLTPMQQAQVQNLYDNIDDFEHSIRSSSLRLSEKFDRLSFGLQELIEQGAITPKNGALNDLVRVGRTVDRDESSDDDDDDVNGEVVL